MKTFWSSLLTIVAVILLATLFAPSPAGADPWLACDPMTSQVELIQVEFTTGVEGAPAVVIDVPAVDITKNIGVWALVNLDPAIAPGKYKARARASYGIWGWSEWSAPFPFKKPATDAPAGTRLETLEDEESSG